MNITTQQEVQRRLVQDFEFKEREKYLQQGVCPKCHKREMFTSRDAPWLLKCGRENKCGHEQLVKELYPDIFEDWSTRYQSTQEAPHAAATAYLEEARGLDTTAFAGAYRQGAFVKDGMGSATVIFRLENGTTWERLIDQPSRFGKQKANIRGSYAGHWWVSPGVDLVQAKSIWITEGILNALSLSQAGCTAVATLSSSNYPLAALDTLAQACGDNPRPRLIWAFDDDRAGRRHMVKFALRARDAGWTVSAALPSENGSDTDWNDLLLRERLTEKDIKGYRHYGRLLLAESASAKALEIREYKGWNSFHFVFGGRTYWFAMDTGKYTAALQRIQETESVFDSGQLQELALRESGSLEQIASCVIEPLFYMRKSDTDEAWYHLRIRLPDGSVIKSTFTAGQLAGAPEFKKRLLHMARGALYTGTAAQLNIIVKSLESIPEVQTIDYIGYSREHQTWIFNRLAVSHGQMYHVNDDDYFDLPSGAIKSLSLRPDLKLNDDFTRFDTRWVEDIWTSFGATGYVTLAFWFGSFFAEQVRIRNKSYPALELSGEHGTGKTTLIEFLWKLCGRENYEGLDPSKASAAARGRSFVQVANMPVVLMEGDREDTSKGFRGNNAFDFNEIKSLYNGRPPRALGVKANNNETYEPLFRGSILIAQNDAVKGSDAVLTRIVHMFTDKSRHSEQTLQAAERLEATPVESVSGFMLLSALREKQIMEAYERYFDEARNEFLRRGEVTLRRIIKCHAQIMAFLSVLPMIIPLPAERVEITREYIFQLARQRQDIVHGDSLIVREFWELVEYLNGREEFGINHSDCEGIWAINFNHIEEAASLYRQSFSLPLSDMKEHIRSGKSYKFLGVKTIRSFISRQHNAGKNYGRRLPETYRCWVFERAGGVHSGDEPDDE